MSYLLNWPFDWCNCKMCIALEQMWHSQTSWLVEGLDHLNTPRQTVGTRLPSGERNLQLVKEVNIYIVLNEQICVILCQSDISSHYDQVWEGVGVAALVGGAGQPRPGLESTVLAIIHNQLTPYHLALTSPFTVNIHRFCKLFPNNSAQGAQGTLLHIPYPPNIWTMCLYSESCIQ